MEVFLLSSCWKINNSIPNYNGIDEFAEYVNNSAEVEIYYWNASDIDKGSKTANITVIVTQEISFAELDSIRKAANKYLSDNPDYFLNDYYICITVLDSFEMPSVVYARFANFENMSIPVSHSVEGKQYESLCVVEAYISEDDIKYMPQLNDVISLRIHPADSNNESLMIGCLDAAESMNNLNDIYVVDEWYNCFVESDLECNIHRWIWTSA